MRNEKAEFSKQKNGGGNIMQRVRVTKYIWLMVLGKKRRAYRQAPYADTTIMLGQCLETEERVEDVLHAFRRPSRGYSGDHGEAA